MTTTTLTDGELGSYLLDLRGRQWIAGAVHDRDPYALLLRGFGDPAAHHRRMAERGPLFLSSAGVWVATARDVCAAVIDGPEFGLWYPDPADGRRSPYAMPRPLLAHVLGLDEASLRRPRGEYEAIDPEPWRPLAERVAQRWLAGASGPGDPGDLGDLARVARGIAADVVAGAVGVDAGLCHDTAPALDALCCPPPFPVARRLTAAVRELRGRPRNAVLLAVAGTEVAANLMCAVLLDAGEPPVHLQHRVAQQDLDLAGHAVEAGSEIVALTGPHEELALAGGLYLSAVAPFARMCAQVARAAAESAGRLPRPAGPGVRRLRSPVTQAWARLPVTFG
ncbi:cytochrome P450 [Dactylosporangium sp. AC04546]|uniref:cytochrome P450 n=1 Tax=Dactylosporangium sp. AC04546 TaxID=2862460 RepID=UPI001EE05D84|nr:cytochrome P450 [Dactylosporangium sp. AC04546]WVK79052.1 cytochrome P450 [Dactylosporangium sp. AC04546]